MNPRIPFTATIFARRHMPRGRCITGTWGGFTRNILSIAPEITAKEDLPGWSPTRYRGDYRALPNVVSVHALGLDHDRGDLTIDQAAALWADCMGAIHTTWSHTPTAPRLRTILLLSRPISAADYTIVWGWARDRLALHGTVLDEGACDASRYWYLPGRRPGGTYELRLLRGAPLDVDAIIATERLGQGRSTATNRSIDPSAGTIGVSGARRGHPLPEMHHHPLAPVPRRASTTPRASKEVGAAAAPPIPVYFVAEAMRAAGLVWGSRQGGRLLVTCPWAETHSGGRSGDGSTVVLPPSTSEGWGALTCHHAHCAQRTTLDLLDVLPLQALATARRICGGGPLRARVIRAFVQHLDERPGGYGIAGQPAMTRVVLHLLPVGVDLRFATVDPTIIHTVVIGCEAHTAIGSPVTDAAARALGGRVVQLTMEIVKGRDVVKKIALVPRR